MKKFLLLCLSLCTAATTFGQNISDAVRFSQNEVQGTARFRALSGAFGALGGDLSAVNINPASSAVFNQSQIALTFNNTSSRNDTGYFGTDTNTTNSDFNFAQGGAAFVFKNTSNSPWKKFTLSFAYDRTNSFDDNWNAIGTNTNSNNLNNTIGSYFFEFANNFPTDNNFIGLPINEVSALEGESIDDAYINIGNEFGFNHQQAFLGLQSLILSDETDENGNTRYFLDNLIQGNFDHDFLSTSNGYSGKVAFNFATQYEDNIYLGLNLNSHFIDYENTTSLIETNLNGNLDPSNPDSRLVEVIDFQNSISTVGRGFSFQLGGIVKLTPEFRVGVTYDSPTWYTIEEETSQILFTRSISNGADINTVNVDEVTINPQILNVFPSYRIQTPGRVAASAAYIFGKRGLISFDYSSKNYGATRLRPDSDFSGLNSDLSDVLTTAATYRIGGEYKYQAFSFRGGYRYEESPYANGVTVGDLNGFSLGLGYNFGNTKLDLTFDQWQRTDQTPLFNVGLIDTANIDRRNSTFTLGLAFNI